MNQHSLSVWRGAVALIRFRPGYFLVNVLFGSFFIAARLAPGWLEKGYYDRLTGTAPTMAALWGVLGLIVIVELTRLTTSVLGEWGGAHVRNAAGSLLRHNIMAAILRRPGALPLPVAPGDAINRLDDDVADFADFPTWTPEVLGHLAYTMVALAVMVSIAPLVTAVALLPLLGVFFLNRFAWSRFLRYGHESRAASSQVTGFLGEILGAVQAIKVADAEAGAMGYFHRLNERRRRLNVRYQLFYALFEAANTHLGDLAVGVMVIMAGGALARGDFSVGDFALFSSYLFFAARFPATLGSFLSEIAQQRVVLDRVQELIPEAAPRQLVAHAEIHEASHRRPVDGQNEPRLPAVPFVSKTAAHRLASVTVRGLTVRHPAPANGRPGGGIFDVDLDLMRGSFTVITGPVGAGKTTLLRAVLGLLPAAGEIRWNGQIVVDPAAFFVPPRSAYTAQVPRLFSESLRDNILMGLPASQVDLPGAVQQAVLGPDVATLENGLDTVVGPRGVRLSGGQVQRAAAARMFVRRAELLVVDDLSSALDVETEQLLWQRLRVAGAAAPGPGGEPVRDPVTCLVVSHRRPALQQADQVILMAQGRVAARGPLSELLATSPQMQTLWQRTSEEGYRATPTSPAEAPARADGLGATGD